MKREIMARRAELVPRTRPVPTRPAHPIRARLRQLLIPPHSLTYLAPGETAVITTRRHWLVPLREISGGLLMMTGVGLLTRIRE